MGVEAHSDHVGMDSELGDELVQVWRRKGSPAMARSGEAVAVAPRRTSARGSVCSMERRTAELLDTAVRRGGDSGYGFHGSAGAIASAMVGESEGEDQGANGGVGEVGATSRKRSTRRDDV